MAILQALPSTARVVWSSPGILVQLGVRLAVVKAPAQVTHESFVERTACGSPITMREAFPDDELPEALAGDLQERGDIMTLKDPEEGAPQDTGAGGLVKEIFSQVELLVRKEVELAKNELRADLRTEARVAREWLS